MKAPQVWNDGLLMSQLRVGVLDGVIFLTVLRAHTFLGWESHGFLLGKRPAH